MSTKISYSTEIEQATFLHLSIPKTNCKKCSAGVPAVRHQQLGTRLGGTSLPAQSAREMGQRTCYSKSVLKRSVLYHCRHIPHCYCYLVIFYLKTKFYSQLWQYRYTLPYQPTLYQYRTTVQ